MNMVSCLNPVKVWSATINDYVLVPCGSCDACRTSRQLRWRSRIDDESKCWPYSMFITLTYANEHLPVLYYDKDSNTLFDNETSECFELENLVVDIPSTIKYLRSRKWRLPVLSTRDIQLFMKRFRFFSSLLNTNEDKKVRYYIAGEYGPTTHRPHYHGILWFSSRAICASFQEILHKAWPYGIVDFSSVVSNASGYVSGYLCSSGSLPQIYLSKPFRQRAWFSRVPPVGSLFSVREEVSQIFFGAITTRLTERKSTREFIDVPLQPYVKDRLFPKIAGFSGISHYDRVTLYGISKIAMCEEWDFFEAWYQCLLDRDVNCSSYLCRLLSSYVDLHPFDHKTGYSRPWSVCIRPLKRLFRISRRVVEQARIFNISIDAYVSQIELFYFKVEQLKLKKMYEYENEFLKKYPRQWLVNIDPLFVQRAVEEYHNSLSTPQWILNQLESFGLTEEFLRNKELRDMWQLEASPAFKEIRARSYKIMKDSCKTKVKNEYLELHPEYKILH